jgi:hypothetical protein
LFTFNDTFDQFRSRPDLPVSSGVYQSREDHQVRRIRRGPHGWPNKYYSCTCSWALCASCRRRRGRRHGAREKEIVLQESHFASSYVGGCLCGAQSIGSVWVAPSDEELASDGGNDPKAEDCRPCDVGIKFPGCWLAHQAQKVAAPTKYSTGVALDPAGFVNSPSQFVAASTSAAGAYVAATAAAAVCAEEALDECGAQQLGSVQRPSSETTVELELDAFVGHILNRWREHQPSAGIRAGSRSGPSPSDNIPTSPVAKRAEAPVHWVTSLVELWQVQCVGVTVRWRKLYLFIYSVSIFCAGREL